MDIQKTYIKTSDEAIRHIENGRTVWFEMEHGLGSFYLDEKKKEIHSKLVLENGHSETWLIGDKLDDEMVKKFRCFTSENLIGWAKEGDD
jgi:hypothetical protein